MRKVTAALVALFALSFSASLAIAADKSVSGKLPNGATFSYHMPCTTGAFANKVTACLEIESSADKVDKITDYVLANVILSTEGNVKDIGIDYIFMANRVNPMTVQMALDKMKVDWSGGYAPDHILIPREGTYHVLVSTNSFGQTWDATIAIESAGYAN